MAYRLNDFGDSGPSVDASVVVGFIVVLAISIGSFIWVADVDDGYSQHVRVYQQAYTAEQAGKDSASASVQTPAIDTESTTSAVSAAATVSAKPTEPQCNIDACAEAYRSFRVSDCTFQPFQGPRRLCTR
jgi:predicted negative regulator of RcsB-dependent stress response